ncbi:MAG: hypothetical protein ABIA12_00190 [Candidatus Aenigmatarchaeota archaeon]
MPARKPAKRKSGRRALKGRRAAKAKRAAARRTHRKISRNSPKARILRDVERSVVLQESELTELEDTEKAMGRRLDRVAAPGVDVGEELQKKWKFQERARELDEGKEAEEGLGIEAEEEAGEEPFEPTEPDEEEPNREEDDGEG